MESISSIKSNALEKKMRGKLGSMALQQVIETATSIRQTQNYLVSDADGLKTSVL